MLWIFALAIIMPIDIGLCSSAESGVSDTTATTAVNLTAITWDHAVNSQEKLKAALANNLKMIEADVTLGTLIGGGKDKIPIMSHGPKELESDLSLDDFITKVNEYNNGKTPDTVKGIKLDFKSIEAFTKAEDLLKKIAANYVTWLNADILKGPVDSTVQPVDSKEFLTKAKSYEKFTLSVGWTTKWTDAGVTSGKYTEDNVKEMIEALKIIKDSKQPITFPVRAGLVATSYDEMKKLLDTFKDATLTVWSHENDEVNVPKLEKLIKAFGVSKVYLDVPKTLSDKLNLSPDDKPSNSSANKIAHIGLLMSIAMLVLTKLF